MIIWKYTVDVSSLRPDYVRELEVPEGAWFLTSAIQHEQLAVWFEVDPDKPRETRKFQVFITGAGPAQEEGFVYRGTQLWNNGEFVTHLYELVDIHNGGYIKGARG